MGKIRNRQSPKANANWAMIVQLYDKGFSCRKIANQLNLSHGYIYQLLKVHNMTRTARQALIGKLTKPESTHWRTNRQRARKLVERMLGRKLAREYHVHHINGDHTDNRLENLQVIDQITHAYIHRPKNPIPRWLRPERKAYMREYARRRRLSKSSPSGL